MFITDKNKLNEYATPYRIWQGIPGIEVTKKGRVFLTFYSGGVTEDVNNYALLLKSDDGINFSEPIAAAFLQEHRCYDPCLWIDPLGRLWFSWALAPEHAVYAVICDNPDSDELVWSDVIKIGNDVMMNKPTVLSTGEWLFPVAVWKKGISVVFNSENEYPDRKAFAYKSIDNGASFEKLGGADVKHRSFDEHMILELNDGRLAMYVRTFYGIAVSYSFDRGKTWTEGEDSGLGGPCSRFFIRRLKSGRILLINHYNFSGRNNLTAMLSEDEGKTWKYKLLLDGRSSVSYPDAVEADDGYIYITYDRERGAYLHSFDDVYKSAREILVLKITEQDIINGKITDSKSRPGIVASKLGRYALESDNIFREIKRFSDTELVKHLSDKSVSEITAIIFEQFGVNCANLHGFDYKKFDLLIEALSDDSREKEKIIYDIIVLVRSVSTLSKEETPIVELIKATVQENISSELSVNEIADKLGISVYYMCHLFKKTTGITIVNYKNELKITKAKDYLVNSDMKITDIAQKCGFDSSSYFSKMFLESEKVSPSEYRSLLKTM